MMRQKLKQRQSSETVRGWGGMVLVCVDLTCPDYRPVEPVNSGVPEVPIVAEISDNDLCLAMIVKDRYWHVCCPESMRCQ